MVLAHKEIRPPTNIKSRQATKMEVQFYRELILELIDRRKRLKISQQELSDILGMSECYVNKWESGVKFPTMFSFMCWCNALNLKIKSEPIDEESIGS